MEGVLRRGSSWACATAPQYENLLDLHRRWNNTLHGRAKRRQSPYVVQSHKLHNAEGKQLVRVRAWPHSVDMGCQERPRHMGRSRKSEHQYDATR